jgi:hypothetical protein
VLAPRSSPIATNARELGLETPDLGDLEANMPWTFARRLGRVRSWLRSEAIDLVNVHTGAGHSLLAAAAALNGLPLVRTRGDIRLPRIDPAHAWLYRRADHHLTTAEFLRRSVYPPLGVPFDRVTTLLGQKHLTNATGFFFERDERLYLVTSRHVVLDEPSEHHPDRIEIELHVDSENVAKTVQFSIPLYRDRKSVWRAAAIDGRRPCPSRFWFLLQDRIS